MPISGHIGALRLNELNRRDIPDMLEKLESTLGSLQQRQKKRKLADKSEASWLVVKEYKAEELAINSEDEKRIRKAQTTALRKISQAKQPSHAVMLHLILLGLLGFLSR